MKVPTIECSENADPCSLLARFLGRADKLLVLGRGPSAATVGSTSGANEGVLITGPTYVTRDVYAGDPLGVLIGTPLSHVEEIAQRFRTTPAGRQPLLMYAYLQSSQQINFKLFGIPNPVAILPLLSREGLYEDDLAQPYPTSGTFLVLLSAALGRRTRVAGIDLYQHASRKTYVKDSPEEREFVWPSQHSLDCERKYLCKALKHSTERLEITQELRSALQCV